MTSYIKGFIWAGFNPICSEYFFQTFEPVFHLRFHMNLILPFRQHILKCVMCYLEGFIIPQCWWSLKQDWSYKGSSDHMSILMHSFWNIIALLVIANTETFYRIGWTLTKLVTSTDVQNGPHVSPWSCRTTWFSFCKYKYSFLERFSPTLTVYDVYRWVLKSVPEKGSGTVFGLSWWILNLNPSNVLMDVFTQFKNDASCILVKPPTRFRLEDFVCYGETYQE